MIPGKVKIRITGCQTLGEEKDETIVNAEGSCRHEEKDLLIEYTEKPEKGIVIRNIICIAQEGVTISKRGAIVSDMFFKQGNVDEVAYQTPYGTLAMETRCKSLDIADGEKECLIKVEYGLYSGGELVSDCVTEIYAVLDEV